MENQQFADIWHEACRRYTDITGISLTNASMAASTASAAPTTDGPGSPLSHSPPPPMTKSLSKSPTRRTFFHRSKSPPGHSPSPPRSPRRTLAVDQPMSVEELLGTIDASQSKFEKYREKKAKLRSVLTPLMNTVEIFSEIISAGVEMAFPPANLVFGAVTILIQAAGNISSSYDSVIDLFENLKAFATRLQVHSRRAIAPELRAIMVKKLSLLLEVIALSLKFVKDGRAIKFIKQVFSGDDEEIEELVKQIDMLSLQESAMVTALNLAVSYESADGISNVQSKLSKMDSNMQTLLEMVSTKDGEVRMTSTIAKPRSDRATGVEVYESIMKRLLEELQPELSVEADYDNIVNEIVPTTCEWILSEPVFENWFKNTGESRAKSAAMWITGIAGCGKSHIAARIIKWLQEQFPQDVQDTRRTGVAYFFCREGDASRQSFSDIMRTVAYQLAANDQVYGRYLLNAIDSANRHGGGYDGGTTASVGTVQLWKMLFVDFFKSKADLKDNAYVVIDGLDEAFREGFNGVTALLEEMRNFYQDYPKGSKPRLQFLLVGRPDLTDIIYDVLDFKTPMLEISPNSLVKDVEKYINYQINRSRTLRRTSKTFKEELLEKLKGKTFLWVKLVLKEVSSKNRESQMRQAVDNFPDDLAELVGHVLERFSKNDQDSINDLNELLVWVTCARRPFNLGELETIMALASPTMEADFDLERMLRIRYSTFFSLVRSDGLNTADLQDMQRGVYKPLNTDGTADSPTSVRSMYMGGDTPTVVLDIPDDDFTFNSPKPTVVTISHVSFTEYFRKFPRTSDEAVGVDPDEGELHIALLCLSLIRDDRKFEKFGKSSVLAYAASNFFVHLSRANRSKTSVENKAKVLELLYQLFGVQEILVRWCGWVNQWATFLETDEYTSKLMEWIGDADALKGATEELTRWRKEVTEGGVQALLKSTVMEYASQLWQKKPWNTFLAFKFVYCYMQKFDLFPEGKRFVSGHGPDLTPNKRPPLSIDDVNIAGDWVGLPRDARWYARTAVMMRFVGDPVTSMEYYKKAEHAKGFTPGIYQGLAKTYSELKRYKEAIYYSQKAIDGNKGVETWDYGTRWEATWCLAMWKSILASGLENCDLAAEEHKDHMENDQAQQQPPMEEEDLDGDKEQAKEEQWLKNAEEKLKRQESMTDAEKKVQAVKDAKLVQERKQYRDEAMEAFKLAYNDNKTNCKFVIAYLDFCDEWDKSEESMDLLRRLDSEKTSKEGLSHSLLIDFLFFLAHTDEDNDTLLWVAQVTDNIKWLIKVYQRAINVAGTLPGAEPGLVSALRCWLGQIYYQQADGESTATKLFELVINDPSLQKTTTPYTSARIVAADLLAQIYYLAASAAEKRSEDPTPYVKKLRRVGSNPAGRNQMDLDTPPQGNIKVPNPFGEPTREDLEFWSYSTKETAVLLGKWYLSHDKISEGKAIFKELISLSLDLLTDDIIDNDNEGYSRLGYALLMAGDKKNARASYQLVGRYRPEEERAVDERTDDGKSTGGSEAGTEGADSGAEEEETIRTIIRRESTFDSGDYVFNCTYCEEGFTFASGCHICTSGCSYVFFCWECYRLCKKGKFRYRLCDVTHEFFYVSRRGLPRLEKGMVRFVTEDNKPLESIPLQSWIKGLKDKWEI